MNRRRRLLLFCLFALIAVFVLAASLHDVHFEPGRSISNPPQSSPPILLPALDKLADVPLWKIVLFWAAFLVNVILFFYLLPAELRRRVILQAVRFALGVLALLIALRYQILKLPALKFDQVDPPGGASLAANSGLTAAAFRPPAMTPWMTYLISLGVMLALLLLTWAGYRFWMRSRARHDFTLDEIGGIARSSLDDLASGHDWGDVIIQSYLRMSEAVGMNRGLYRAEAMTPREFAERLERAGLPAEGVRRLTRLFESVRYGARRSSPADADEARACLNSILQACGAAQ